MRIGGKSRKPILGRFRGGIPLPAAALGLAVLVSGCASTVPVVPPVKVITEKVPVTVYPDVPKVTPPALLLADPRIVSWLTTTGTVQDVMSVVTRDYGELIAVVNEQARLLDAVRAGAGGTSGCKPTEH